MPMNPLSLESQFWLETLRRYLESCPEAAPQIALDCFADYLQEHDRANRLRSENAALKVQFKLHHLRVNPLNRLHCPKSNRNDFG